MSIYNLIFFHEFFMRELRDLTNLYSVEHNKTNTAFSAPFLIVVTPTLANTAEGVQNKPTTNPIFDFYSRSKQEIVGDIDKTYKILYGKSQDTSGLDIPLKSSENQTFVNNCKFPFTENFQQETYLRVVLQSDWHVHEDLNCNKERWFYRPELHARLITILPVRYDKLDPQEKQEINTRKANKTKNL